MNQLQNLISVLQKLQESSTNLSKDIDPKDSREQTGKDLTSLSSAFQDLQSIFSSIREEDMNKITTEFNELISGKQNFLEYTRDVNAILMAVRERAKEKPEIKEKIVQNLPVHQQGENPDALFKKYSDILNQILGMTTKAGR